MTPPTRLAVLVGTYAAGLAGWFVGGCLGAAVGLASGVLVAAVPWRGRQIWSWLALYRRYDRDREWADPVAVADDRTAGGVRYLDGTVVAAVQVLGRRHRPTLFTGAMSVVSEDTLDIAALQPLLRQPLGLHLESLSVVSFGLRRRTIGDYPRLYDTLIGTPPYAGTRETWLILRIAAIANADALQHRISAGSAALAAAQRVAAALRRGGVRARVASATDIAELDRRIGGRIREHRWRTLRTDRGWCTSYAYRPQDIGSAALSKAWTLRIDGLIQNVTLFPDATLTATLTVCTNQPPPAPPSVLLTSLPGEQADALSAARAGPTIILGGVRRIPVPQQLVIPVGPSGVLVGRAVDGHRLTLPLIDPAEPTRVHLGADDALAKRLILRAAGAGECVTVHTADRRRWHAMRIPGITITDGPRPAAGTDVSVVDGAIIPSPRPNTVILLAPPDAAVAGADIAIVQTGPAVVEIRAEDRIYPVTMDLFRAEKRYLRTETTVDTAIRPETSKSLR